MSGEVRPVGTCFVTQSGSLCLGKTKGLWPGLTRRTHWGFFSGSAGPLESLRATLGCFCPGFSQQDVGQTDTLASTRGCARHFCSVVSLLQPRVCSHCAPTWHFCCLIAQLCLTLCDPVDCSLLGNSAPGIFQARTLEWVALSFFRGSSQPRDQTWVSGTSCIGRWMLHHLSHQRSPTWQFRCYKMRSACGCQGQRALEVHAPRGSGVSSTVMWCSGRDVSKNSPHMGKPEPWFLPWMYGWPQFLWSRWSLLIRVISAISGLPGNSADILPLSEFWGTRAEKRIKVLLREGGWWTLYSQGHISCFCPSGLRLDNSLLSWHGCRCHI